jgi:prevent-host-death family protein
MITVGLYEAKTRLSELIRDAETGQDVVITRHGKPAVRLVAVTETTVQRELGHYRDTVWVAEDFDETPEEFGDYL